MVDVLVVEDDAGLREAICDMLALNKISYHEVENGKMAAQYLSDNSASLVLSDVQMSPGNGYELLSSIRKKPNGYSSNFNDCLWLNTPGGRCNTGWCCGLSG